MSFQDLTSSNRKKNPTNINMYKTRHFLKSAIKNQNGNVYEFKVYALGFHFFLKSHDLKGQVLMFKHI